MWISSYSTGPLLSIITPYNAAPSETLTSGPSQVSPISGLQISATVVGTEMEPIHDVFQGLSQASDYQQGAWAPPARPPQSFAIPTPTANSENGCSDFASRSRVSAPLIGGLCGGSFLVISTTLYFFLRRRRRCMAERKFTPLPNRRSSLRSLAGNKGPPLPPPLDSPRFSFSNTNPPGLTMIHSLVRSEGAQNRTQPISLSAHMLDAVALLSTADDQRESPIERPREARLYHRQRQTSAWVS
ncbi:hypothetical protein HYPSUDRAFT_48276 [Hypholoma sublateritium FD-334 SS-4]|uniref:Uncharacterized protein n=1 Tax=Hypholoma sublateritium (strain FD-334 SS-4) TaxID=945553 RepID=A0A0D2KLL6_HYPSF|nr:hypothetical protein HYPSUDRAFT_48276 [Hypholoma sublateritium FD-334 SS-4]